MECFRHKYSFKLKNIDICISREIPKISSSSTQLAPSCSMLLFTSRWLGAFCGQYKTGQ